MAEDKEENLDRDGRAVGLVMGEKTAWENKHVNVTPKVAFVMRDLIQQCRKNYWGIFNNETDPITGREKIWIPLTESTVEAVVKSIDLDTKDINFRAKKKESIGVSHLVRSVVENELERIRFGENLDEMERQLAIDGTAVWKTVEKDGKVETQNVDILNIFVDPTTKTLQDAYRVTERSLMTRAEIRKMDWRNKDRIETSTTLNPAGEDTPQSGTSELVDVWEMWGAVPKDLITGKEEDEGKEVEGHIVVSGIETGSVVVHKIEKNKLEDQYGNTIRPYEEAWFTRVSGRWYGRGVAEKLLMLQLYLNTLVNIRINRSYVSQLGLFKIRRGSGITPGSISQLAANGAILVNNTDDIQQLVMQEASQASYNDEENIIQWSQRVTSAFEVVTGEKLPASTTATAVASQGRNAQSQFTLIKEGIGMFLQRWMTRHALRIIQRNMSKEQIARVGGREALEMLDEHVVNRMLIDEMEKLEEEEGARFDPQQVAFERRRALNKLRSMGDERYFNIVNKFDFSRFDVKVFITNEEFDKGVMVQNLTSALQLAPQEMQQDIIAQIFDLMGLQPPRPQRQPQQRTGQREQVAQGAEQPQQNIQRLLTEANTAQNVGRRS